MNNSYFNDNLESDPILNNAVEVLCGTVTSEPPSELLDRIVADLESAEAAEARSHAPARLCRSGRMQRIAAVLAFVVAGFGLLSWLLPQSRNGVALGQVIEKTRTAKTITYDVAIVRSGSGSTLRYSVMISGARRREVDEQDESITIRDEQSGESIKLYPAEKRAVVIKPTSSRPASQSTGEGLDLARQFEKVHAAMRAGAEKKLGRKQIDGRACTGFEKLHEGVRTTIWVDEASLLPVQVENVIVPLEDQPTIFSNIRFDVDLDPTLFDLMPPSDHRVQQFKPITVAVPTGTGPAPLLPGQPGHQPATERDVIEYLRYVAVENGNVFPTPEGFLASLPPTHKHRPPSEAEQKTIGAAVQRMMLYQRLSLYLASQKAVQPIYLGEGVKLGDASKPVFAWASPDTKQARVVYGDLSVRDLDLAGEEFQAIVSEYQAKMVKREQSSGWLGIEPQDADSRQGCLVSRVLPGSPAEKAGLRKNDVITRMGDQPVRSQAEWRAAMRNRKAGDSIIVGIRRGNEVINKDLVLGSRPSE